MTALIVCLLTLTVCVVGLAVYGNFCWAVGTQKVRTRIATAQVSIQPAVVEFGELESLPSPVQRFFRTVLKDGQAAISSTTIRHTGQFNIGPETALWKPFVSEQLIIAQCPGFDWNAKIAIGPGLSIRVQDAYVMGEGWLQVSFLGVFSPIKLQGTGPLAEGELMRFFAESALYPTALLPSQGVQWQPIDLHSARGTLSDGNLDVSLVFTFNEHGPIDSIRAEARGRAVGNDIIPTPWLCRFWNYQNRDGMLVPLDGEVAWLLPEGAKPYWCGQITDIAYEYAG